MDASGYYRAKHAAFVAVQSEEFVLLVKRRKDVLWGFAGGRAQPSETPLETARRKLQEELGITVAGSELKEVASRPNEYFWTNQTHYLFSYQVTSENLLRIRTGRNGHVTETRRKATLRECILEEHIIALIHAMQR